MLLAEVVGYVVHVTCSPYSPKLGIELLGRLDEVTGQVCLGCTLNLIQVSAWGSIRKVLNVTYSGSHKSEDTCRSVSGS